MKDWFDSLEIREKYFVSIGAVIATLGLAYGLVWAPLDRSHDMLRADVSLWQDSLQALRPLRNSANSADSNNGSGNTGAQQSPIIV